MTSATTSRISCSFKVAAITQLGSCVVNFFSEHINRIYDADNDSVNGCFLKVRREARGTALTKENQFADARADAIYGDDRVGACAEFGRVLFVNELRPQEQQLASIHGRVL